MKLPATRQTKRSPRPESKAFRGDARIRTAQNAGIRVLPGGQRLALVLEVVAPRHPLHITTIAVGETLESGLRRQDVAGLGRRRLGGEADGGGGETKGCQAGGLQHKA